MDLQLTKPDLSPGTPGPFNTIISDDDSDRFESLPPTTPRPLTSLADAIVRAHANVQSATRAMMAAKRSMLAYAREAGDLLIEAKETVPHGSWLNWLAANCPGISERVAQNYMRIAENWERLPVEDPNHDSHLPVREALKLLASGRDDAAPGVPELTSADLAPGGITDEEAHEADSVTPVAMPAPEAYARVVTLVFDATEHAEFFTQLSDLEAALNTRNKTETIVGAVRHAHRALCSKEARAHAAC
jgi:hypothetical protein